MRVERQASPADAGQCNVARLLRGSDVEKSKARATRKKVPRRGAELVPRRVHHLRLKHRVAVHQVCIELAALGKLREASG